MIRNTLREAIRTLVHVGLLETRQGSRTTVLSQSSFEVAIHRHIQKIDLFETLEVRLALEKEAAHLAVKRRNQSDLKAIQKYIELCELYADKDGKKFLDADINLHQAIVQASHNQLLIELYESMTDILYQSIKTFLVMPQQTDREEQAHRSLYEAIYNKDVEKARQSVNEYIDELKDMINSLKGDINYSKFYFINWCK